jgi:hypothetical protein
MNEENHVRYLFLMFEGIGSTIFNSQVAVHVNEMNKNNLKFDILSFETWRKQWKKSNENLILYKNNNSNLNIKLSKGINIYLPLLNLMNVFLFLYYIYPKRKDYKLIHARSDYAAFISIITRPLHKLPVIWDCRGDSVDELRYSFDKKNILLRLISLVYLLPILRIRLFIINRFADRAIFVSEALRNHYYKFLKTSNYRIIPCPVSENIFYFDNKLRNEKRKELNFGEEQRVFLYSGSMVGYQFITGLEKFFEKILMDPNNIVMILTSEPDKAKKYFSFLSDKKLLILSAPFMEMVAFYNAADFAILIRESRRLNYVSSPTKFGEYCLSGLPVIMNDTVEQAFTIANEIGNYISSDDIPKQIYRVSKRTEISKKSKQYFSRSVLNKIYLELYE